MQAKDETIKNNRSTNPHHAGMTHDEIIDDYAKRFANLVYGVWLDSLKKDNKSEDKNGQ